MINRLKSKLLSERRNRIILEVRETNLQAQLFLKQCGFRVQAIVPKPWPEREEDAYLFTYRYQPTDDESAYQRLMEELDRGS
jgi:ribosomal-protein-alanine N-acetyltransferase